MMEPADSAKKFDPFSDRRSRDIRNSLAEAFVTSLTYKDQTVYRNVARQWQAENLAPVYNDYIADRLQRYGLVFEQIQHNHLDDQLLEALVIWNCGLFFEVHDHLEIIWRQTSGEERQALKGLIKAAGVYVHLGHHHQQAAERLAGKSFTLMRQHAHCLDFIANLKVLLENLKNLAPDPPRLENPAIRSTQTSTSPTDARGR
ncbi:MAG: DUF309 domain-containing protein [Desulfobacterales bacterium]|nr:MAG: DUF309 domain-containing protein [Desulfobacterales bacterium]